MPRVDGSVGLVEHFEQRGSDLFRVACEHDLEGIVGKWKHRRYAAAARSTSWVKVKNQAYSQMKGRRDEFFENRATSKRATQPTLPAFALR